MKVHPLSHQSSTHKVTWARCQQGGILNLFQKQMSKPVKHQMFSEVHSKNQISGFFLACSRWEQTEPFCSFVSRAHTYNLIRFPPACCTWQILVCLTKWRIISTPFNKMSSKFSILGGFKDIDPHIHGEWRMCITWHTANSTCWKVDSITKRCSLHLISQHWQEETLLPTPQTFLIKSQMTGASLMLIDSQSVPHFQWSCRLFCQWLIPWCKSSGYKPKRFLKQYSFLQNQKQYLKQ